MNSFLKTFLAIILSTMFLIPVNAYADSGSSSAVPDIVNPLSNLDIRYTSSRNSVRANNTFDLTIILRPQSAGTDLSNITLVRLEDSFTTEQNEYKVSNTSTPSSTTLESYKIEIKNCKWNGGSNNFEYALVDGQQNTEYKTLTIAECTGASNDSTVYESPKFSAYVNSDTVIKAGESGVIHFELKNYGRGVAENVIVSVQPSEDVLIDGDNVFEVSDVGSYGDSVYIDVKYKAVGNVNSASQYFTLNVDYDYGNSQRGSETLSVYVNSEVSSTDKSHPIITAECDLTEKMLAADTEYSGTLTLKNVGAFNITGISVSFDDGEDFIMTGNTGLRYIEGLKTGETTTVPIKLKTLSSFSSVKQPLSMKVSYSYAAAGGVKDDEFTRSFVMLAPASTNSTKAIPVVTMSKMSNPITTGSKYTQDVYIDNKGGTDMENITVTLRGSEKIIVSSETANAFIEKIAAGEQGKIKVTYTTAAEFTDANQSLTVSLAYSGDQTAETVIPLDSKITAAETTAPVVRMTGSGPSSAVVADTTYDYTLTFTNYGKVDVNDFYAELTASDSIVMVDNSDFIHISSIKPGKSASAKVSFKTTDPITSTKQSITAKMTYNYGTSSSSAQGTSEGHVEIVADVPDNNNSGDSKSAVPNVIIGSYDIGAEQIAAGDAFTMDLQFYNTNNSVPIENLILTISAGEGVNIGNGVNTYFYPSLEAGGKIEQPIELKALTTAETGVSQITIGFKYDYMHDDTRSTAESSQAVFIPIYQPDKMSFEVSPPTYEVYTGNETYITTTYLNRGRSTISNVKAELVGDVEALSTSKVVGNVEAGKNGSFDFVVIPQMGGECSFTIKITYEDSAYNEVTKELPVKFNVQEMGGMDFPIDDFPIDDGMVPEEESKFPLPLLFVIIGVVLAGGAVAVILIVRRKKKKNKPLTEKDIDWEDDLDDLLSNGSNNSNNNHTNKV